MKRGIALIICLFAMTIQAHLTHAAEASLHEDKPAPVKRKALYHSDDGDKRRKAACANDKAYYAANKEKIADQNAAYHAENKEKIADQKAAYRAANKEKTAAYRAAYYAANKEKIAARKADYYAANKEKIAAYRAAYRAANKEKRLERLATGNPAALASLQVRIDKAQDQPGAGENPFLNRYNEACTEPQMNPDTPRAALAAEILCNLVKNLQSEQAALRQGDDESEEAGEANFTPKTPLQALEDLLSDNEESPVEDDE